jgi:membrane protease YdiL (CAAX protease family)
MRKIFGENLNLDWKIALTTIVSTLLLMVDYYRYPILPWQKLLPGWEATGLSMKVLDRTLLYFIVPMVIIIFIFNENPKYYGFTIGDWKVGITITLVAVLLISPVLWVVGKTDTSMHDYYRSMMTGLPWSTLLDLFGWEFLFRGWLLFCYTRKFGSDGIWLQSVPFALAHIGKPTLETFSTIFGGFAFGWVAWRTKSFVYPLIIHWFISTIIIIFAAGVYG